MSDDITLAGYLFKRLHQVGLHTVHSIPGNHNLAILREATDPGIEWVAHRSDLTAGLVADGYARVKGVAALIPSFENIMLSSLATALAASYRNRIPVVVVIVTPQRKAQAQDSNFHHAFF